jgi:hypothetical protein
MVIELVVVGIKSRTSWTFNLTGYLETLPKTKTRHQYFTVTKKTYKLPDWVKDDSGCLCQDCKKVN